MKFALLLLSCMLSWNGFGQDCLNQIDSIFIQSDTTNFEKESAILSDSCKIGWYHFYLGKANFFQDRITELEGNTKDLLFSLSKDHLSIEDNYILRSRAGLMICLLIEEYRRTKDRKKFNEWKSTYDKLKIDQFCTTSYTYRISLVIRFMKIRFERMNNQELVRYYDKLKKDDFKRYSRKFFNY